MDYLFLFKGFYIQELLQLYYNCIIVVETHYKQYLNISYKFGRPMSKKKGSERIISSRGFSKGPYFKIRPPANILTDMQGYTEEAAYHLFYTNLKDSVRDPNQLDYLARVLSFYVIRDRWPMLDIDKIQSYYLHELFISRDRESAYPQLVDFGNNHLIAAGLFPEFLIRNHSLGFGIDDAIEYAEKSFVGAIPHTGPLDDSAEVFFVDPLILEDVAKNVTNLARAIFEMSVRINAATYYPLDPTVHDEIERVLYFGNSINFNQIVSSGSSLPLM